jgi:hypothetical protein
LGHEYGWAKREILEDVYFDELYYLLRKINKRKLQDYKMRLAIAENPHKKDNKALWSILNSEEDKLEYGGSKDETFDAAGLEILKARMRNNPRIIVK